MFPKAAHTDRQNGALSRLLLNSGLITFALVFLVSLAGYLLSPPIIRIAYGARYEDAIVMSKIYWIVHGLNAGFRLLPMNLLPAVGATYFNMAVSVISCLFHFFLIRWLLPLYGIYGAAYAIIVIYLISGTAYWLYLFFRIRHVNE